jgi:hypothetical protein
MAFAIRVLMGVRARHVLAAAAILLWSGSSHSASAACVVPSDTEVISVQRIPAPEAGSERLLQLGDRIAIKVKNLGDLLKDPNCTPVFSATLLGLMGLSAGTYLGLKIPESTVPKQQP